MKSIMAKEQKDILIKKYNRIERDLQKVRGCSPVTHGWQTSKYAKASRKWDMLSLERMKVIQQLEDLGVPYEEFEKQAS